MTARLKRAKLSLTKLLLKILFLPKPEFCTGQQNDEIYEEIYLEIVGDKVRKEVELPESMAAAEF